MDRLTAKIVVHRTASMVACYFCGRAFEQQFAGLAVLDQLCWVGSACPDCVSSRFPDQVEDMIRVERGAIRMWRHVPTETELAQLVDRRYQPFSKSTSLTQRASASGSPLAEAQVIGKQRSEQNQRGMPTGSASGRTAGGCGLLSSAFPGTGAGAGGSAPAGAASAGGLAAGEGDPAASVG